MKTWRTWLAGLLVLLPVLALASPILPDRQKEAELLALLKALDSVRDHAVRQSLGDVDYRQHRARTAERLGRMSEAELIAEIQRLEKKQLEAAQNLMGAAKPNADDSLATDYSGDPDSPGSSYGSLNSKGDPDSLNSYRTYSSMNSDESLKSGDSYRTHSSYGSDDRGADSSDSFGTYSNAGYESNRFYDATLVDYDIELPELITEKNYNRKSQGRSVTVRVNPSKMQLLKQKQKLNKVLTDDVLGLTGKLP